MKNKQFYGLWMRLAMLSVMVLMGGQRGWAAENTKPVLILTDVSGSMQEQMEMYRDSATPDQPEHSETKIAAVKKLLLRFSRECNLSCHVGIYLWKYQSGNPMVYQPFVAIGALNPEKLRDRIEKELVTDFPVFNRRTPMGTLIRELDDKELNKLNGNITLVIISDGCDSFYDPDEDKIASEKKEFDIKDNVKGAQTEVRRLKAKYADRLIVHTVYVGTKGQKTEDGGQKTDKGETALQNMAKMTGGSNWSLAKLLENPSMMAELCDKVCPKVQEAKAATPEPAPKTVQTPPPVMATPPPMDADSDHDGVKDKDDLCPGTPNGAKVNRSGCWTLTGLLFQYKKWDIQPPSYPILDEVANVLKQNPNLNIEIQGHTDNIGSTEYNQSLSEKRAQSVKDYLIRKGIAAERLTSKGFGFSKPAASNDTPEGRDQNRRVELKPIESKGN